MKNNLTGVKKLPDCFSALKATVISIERTIGNMAYLYDDEWDLSD